jgi:hypothetical protein
LKWPALVVALSTCACRAPSPRHAERSTIHSCDYQLSLTADGRARVRASCQADGPIAFRLTAPYLRANVKSDTRPSAGRFAAPHGRLSYEVDLGRLALRSADFDRAERIGASIVATMSSVLLVPEPLTTEIPVTLRVAAAPELAVAVGLRRGKTAGSYELMAHEIPVATYFAFGKLQQRTLRVGGSKLELSRLDGPLAPSFDELSQWVETSARAVSDFYGAFPVPRASVTIIPLRARDEVVFGKVLPESEPGIALLVGEHAGREALYGDWILVHELFHLGFPSLYGGGKWLDEGLATYYEPIIRARAGLYTETELWNELELRMPEGLPAYTELGLEQARNFQGIYWGGAIACLVADVEARRADPRRGLEVGLRALREAGGTASEVWSLEEAVTVIDRALGGPILAPIVRAHARRGTHFDLARLFADLGVRRDARGRVQLADDAPLAAVRRAITAR